MKRIAMKVVLGALAAIAATACALLVAVLVRQDRTFDAPYPQIHASKDPAIIARGKYLAQGPGHCVECHGAPEDRHVADGALSGGFEIHLPIATVRIPNITSDPETGIGALSDRQIARVLRHGVRPDGRVALPFMNLANASDADLTAIVSYLRTLPAVSHRVEPTSFNLLGKLALAFFLEPQGPSRPVPATIAPAPTADYGAYLAHSVAGCVKCHTRIDLRTGVYSGPLLGGGNDMDSDSNPDVKLTPPDLRPGGRLAGWDEETFVQRFRRGSAIEGTPMPWAAFGRMTDDDLRAIYRYLAALTPDQIPFATR